jgi:hypothetical protein
MSKLKKPVEKEQEREQGSEQARDLDELPSSPGDDPLVVTPKDVPPDVATARDQRVLPVTSPDPVEREDALLDEAIEETFPASDPIAVPSLNEVEQTLRKSKAHKDKPAPAHPKPKK